MFKSLLLLSLSIAFSAQSAMAFELGLSAKTATDQVVAHYGDESVAAYKVEKELGENFVTVQTRDHGHLFNNYFGCHLHGSDMFCHHEGDDHDHKYVLKHDHDEEGGVAIATLRAGDEAALRSFSRRLDVNSVVSYKVWSVLGHAHKNDHDHDEEVQVWVRYDYLVNGTERIAYFMCHGHAGSTELFCHRETQANDEPEL
jgi:hypothetical protein